MNNDEKPGLVVLRSLLTSALYQLEVNNDGGPNLVVLRSLLTSALHQLEALEAQPQAQSSPPLPPPPSPPQPPEKPEPPAASPPARDVASERVAQVLRTAACPYLKGKRGTRRAYLSSRNLCYSRNHPEVDPNAGKDYEWGSISKEQQDQFCLTLRYVECPFFVAPEGKGG